MISALKYLNIFQLDILHVKCINALNAYLSIYLSWIQLWSCN